MSIVIPNFNYGDYLAAALESVASQTYSNWELIVVDNFSTDNSEEVCSSFSKLDKLRFIKHANHGILASSRNLGIKESKGQLVAFLDSDDLWEPNKLELAVNAFFSGADVSYHSMKVIRPGLQKISFSRAVIRSRRLGGPVTRDLLLRGNALINSSVVVSKAVLDKVGLLDESRDMVGAEDYNLWLRISIETNSFHRIPGILGSYRIHNSSVSRSQGLTESRRAAAVRNFLRSRELKSSLDPGLLSLLSAREKLATKDTKRAISYLAQALKMGDFEVKVRSISNLVKVLILRLS